MTLGFIYNYKTISLIINSVHIYNLYFKILLKTLYIEEFFTHMTKKMRNYMYVVID